MHGHRIARTLAALTLALLLGLTAALEIHFVDVGQGDGVLLVLPDGRGVVYDAGNDDGAMLRYLRDAGITHLALVIASHPHADHIGGLAAVIDAYAPPFVLDNGLTHTTRTFERYLDAVERSGAQLLEPTERTLTLGDVRLHVLPSPLRPEWGHNDNSIGIIVEYESFRASLTGDAEARLFEWWLATAPDTFAAVHVHKASHHGSANGDTPEALARLRPEIVVVSAGAGNRYGHPDGTIVASYEEAGARVFRSDHHGSVIVTVAPDGTYDVASEHDRSPVLVLDDDRREPSSSSDAHCVDINSASTDLLEVIIHIGPDRAPELVERRPFHDIDDLRRISGIGPARLSDIHAQGLACTQ
ncbi:MAG: MBL fold metallo-hydrolase [Trueperaceae bacterium]|nr:MBL fold metallo-hydrolase [Trueperaceae bacterium]